MNVDGQTLRYLPLFRDVRFKENFIKGYQILHRLSA